jgi:SSS family solute:Na+ symporter
VAFSGFVTLVPVLALGARWRRFTAAGALASILLGNLVYAFCLWHGGGLGAALRPAWLGLLPVFWGLAAALAGALFASWLTPAQGQTRIAAAFGTLLP